MERLGGIDFDEALFTTGHGHGPGVAARWSTPNDPATLAAIARLREECRRAKEALSSDTDATISVVLPGLQTEMRLTREEFEEMIRPRITETIGALGRAVKSAGLEFDGLDRILLVGGSSRIPLVAEMVREATGRPIAVDAHPKHSMALGAAYRRRGASAGRGDRGRGRGRRRGIAAAAGLPRRPGSRRRRIRSPPAPRAGAAALRARCRGRATGRRCRTRGGRASGAGGVPPPGGPARPRPQRDGSSASLPRRRAGGRRPPPPRPGRTTGR